MLNSTTVILNSANKIPSVYHNRITEIVTRNENSISYPNADLAFLFKIYNDYVGIDKQVITCPACRTKVVSKMILFVKNWQLQND